MSIAQHITQGLGPTMWVVKSYLEDLTDEELFVRPVEGANHIAWQLGHAIAAERQLIEMVCPGSMPPLPAGFAEKHTTETSKLDDPAAFCSKQEYLRLMDEQHEGMLRALAKLSDAELEKPTPEAMQKFAPNVGVMFSAQGMHWMMHAGQWAVVRRKLGRPPLF
jgi:hypothetical protein